jgi:hypothetical protein
MVVHFSPAVSSSKGVMPLTRLTLLVPELLWPDPEEEVLETVDCPALATLLARGRFSQRPAQDTESLLMESFGYADGTASATLRLRGESEVPADAATARWIAADPVHLALVGERLILADGDALDIMPEEAATLADALNGSFADLGTFHAACAERWYLRLADGKDHALERLNAPPVSAVAGRSVEHLLLEIMKNKKILNFFNEIQTFLHAHPVNRRREENGKATINSLWLWGGGTPPQTPEATEFDEVLGAEALVRGLARAAGLPVRPLPENAETLFAADARQALVVLDDLSEAAHYGNGVDYRQALAALEMRWFAPVRQALAAGVIGCLHLAAPTAYGTLTWDADRAAIRPSWRSWFSLTSRRRPPTLAETVRALAASTGEAA